MSEDTPGYQPMRRERDWHSIAVAWSDACERESEAVTIIRRVAQLDLVPDTQGDFTCPFGCGIAGLMHPSFPHEHAANCPITLARELTTEEV